MGEYVGVLLAAAGVESVGSDVCNGTMSAVTKVTTSDKGFGLTAWAYR